MERRRVLGGIGIVLGLGGVTVCALAADGRRREEKPGTTDTGGPALSRRGERAAAAAMAAAGRALLEGLKPEQRGKAALPFEGEERFNWHFFPRERHGLPFKAMNAAQRTWAHAFLQTGMGHAGSLKDT